MDFYQFLINSQKLSFKYYLLSPFRMCSEDKHIDHSPSFPHVSSYVIHITTCLLAFFKFFLIFHSVTLFLQFYMCF